MRSSQHGMSCSWPDHAIYDHCSVSVSRHLYPHDDAGVLQRLNAGLASGAPGREQAAVVREAVELVVRVQAVVRLPQGLAAGGAAEAARVIQPRHRLSSHHYSNDLTRMLPEQSFQK